MKNILIVALVGLSFLTSGFLVGLRFAPMPKKPVPVVIAHAAPKPVDPKVAFSVDSLKRASENMQSINDALQAREKAVAAREKAAAQKEDELAAERAALDRLHAQFKTLYGQFQQRLQLVTDTETGALERQVTIFGAMDPTQSVDLVRSLDDATVTRLFALMEDKPLAKIVSAWKQKYPADTARLLGDLNGIGRVVAKAKIDLPDMAPAADTGVPAAPTSTDISTPPSAPADTTSDNVAPPAASTDAAAPAPVTDGSISGHEPYANAGTTPPDLGAPDAPATPPAPASVPDAAAPAMPSSDQDQTTPPPVAPADSDKAAPAPAAAPASGTSSASTESSLLESPGERAARAAAPRTTHDDDSTPTPSEFTPPTPTMRLAHDKPTRFASARNN